MKTAAELVARGTDTATGVHPVRDGGGRAAPSKLRGRPHPDPIRYARATKQFSR